MIRRAFVRALSGAILTTLLGLKVWRLEASVPDEEWVRVTDMGEVRPLVDWDTVRWEVTRAGEVVARGVGITPEGDGFVCHAGGESRQWHEWLPEPRP